MRHTDYEQKIFVKEASGLVLQFKPIGEWDLRQRLATDCDMIPYDVGCNTTSGVLSGQTNLTNYRLHFDVATWEFHLTTGSGEQRIYRLKDQWDLELLMVVLPH